MKKIIAATAVGGALLAGSLLAPGTAAASPGLDHDALVYLQMLNNDGLNVNDATSAIQFAQWTCSEMAAGYSVYQVRDMAWNIYGPVGGLSRQNFLTEAEDGAIVFCPQIWHAQVAGPSQPGQEA